MFMKCIITENVNVNMPISHRICTNLEGATSTFFI
uniref:Uncharacterized protein n=1 Tax=Arundo donax TaxID=35708 RepID=A0A0A8YFJ8_ARUDO